MRYMIYRPRAYYEYIDGWECNPIWPNPKKLFAIDHVGEYNHHIHSGVVICLSDKGRFGYAICRVDDVFDYTVGKELAYDRAHNWPESVDELVLKYLTKVMKRL